MTSLRSTFQYGGYLTANLAAVVSKEINLTENSAFRNIWEPMRLILENQGRIPIVVRIKHEANLL